MYAKDKLKRREMEMDYVQNGAVTMACIFLAIPTVADDF